MTSLIPNAVVHFDDNNGAPLVGGQVFFYIPNTSTPKATYQDKAQTILNTNPIVLDSRGEAVIWGAGTYRQVVKDSQGNLIWDRITEDPNAGLTGNMTDNLFVAGTDFTPGTTTALTLSVGPGSLQNTWVYFDGVFQADNQIQSLNGLTLTFNAPIPVGVGVVTVKIGTTVAIGTPGDGTVTDAKVATGSSLYNRITYLIDARDKGATGNGVTDDRAALAATDAAGNPWFLSAGTYRVGSNLTINSHLMLLPGAILKPDAGVTVTFAQNFTASTGAPQIFDISNTGANISLPYNMTEVWAEWWGARGDAVKTNNDVPIQQALNAVAATATGGTGVSYGTVKLGRGWFLTSAGISIPNYTSLVGSTKGYTVIKANATTWSPSANVMFVATNNGLGMFDSNIKNMRISASQINAITYVVYTTAWQESSGMSNCLILNFMNYGFFYEIGDAGAATMRLEDCEFSPDDTSSGATAIYLTNGFTQAWQNFHVVRTTVGTGQNPPNNITGIRAKGRVVVITEAMHFEGVTNGFLLETNATIIGEGVNGGAGQTAVFNCMGSWTGSIRANGCRLGAAANMVVDTVRPYAIAAAEPIDGNLVWPLDGSQPIAVGYITGGASPSFNYQYGRYANAPFNSLTRSSAGVYTVGMAASMDTTTSYDCVVSSQDPNTPIVNANPQNATSVQINTRNASNTLADTQGVLIRVFHKP